MTQKQQMLIENKVRKIVQYIINEDNLSQDDIYDTKPYIGVGFDDSSKPFYIIYGKLKKADANKIQKTMNAKNPKFWMNDYYNEDVYNKALAQIKQSGYSVKYVNKK